MITPFVIKIKNNTIVLDQMEPVSFNNSKKMKLYVYIRAGMKIVGSYLQPEKPLKGTEQEIISQIHGIRFAAEHPYLITGSHFQQSYVRNRGIFFNAMLDPRTSSSEKDWQKRQAIILKTIALDLEVFRLAKKDFTTIVPLSNNNFTAINIYARPSDSLFSILYSLSSLTDPKFIPSIFPTSVKVQTAHMLQTATAAKKLFATYKSSLAQLIENYLLEIIDTETGLIKTTMYLSSARDGIKRSSSFYDNVIGWTTIKLAKDLGIDDFEQYDLQTWKDKIINTFWDEKNGIFRDDLSQNNLLFSGDCFIVTSSRFLDLNNTADQGYLFKIIAYVKKHKLDQPFPLHYSKANEPHKLYWPVRIFAPSYMGESIWSHWGMEYIKTLIILSKQRHTYLAEAEKHLNSYKENIEKYGGYPELYDAKGNNFKNRLYRGVLHNSWVINYEQAKMLYQTTIDKRKDAS